ncbi:phage holin family protein [Bacteroides sp.]|uniref:phage holin family protein n=1 Tax=Bacteroides sp. TaxID=29523 RepID=UPI0025868D94|nr:phage holin family protein [Bacteroides sp.]
MDTIFRTLADKSYQIGSSIFFGLVASFEATIIYFNIALLVVFIDVLSAYKLGKRVAKNHPNKADGKFKSEHKFRILFTLLVFLVALMAAFDVDTKVIGEGMQAQAFVVFAFIFYEVWSIGENWSSENNSLLAKVMQKVMVNKADRHFNLEIKEAIEEAKEELKQKSEVENEQRNKK